MSTDRINTRASFDASQLQMRGSGQANSIHNDFSRGRSTSTNSIPSRLSQLPQRPVNSYRNDLRYQSDRQTKQVVKQNTIDRLTQKNLSRNVKERLTSYNRLVLDGKQQVKGRVGLDMPATTLKQTTSNRDREFITHSLHSAQGNLQQIAQKSTTMKPDEWQFEDQPRLNDILSELDSPAKFKEEFRQKFIEQYNKGQRNPKNRIKDSADLSLRLRSDQRLGERFNSYFRNNHWRALSKYYWDQGNTTLSEEFKPGKNLRKKDHELNAAEDRLIRNEVKSKFQSQFDNTRRDLKDILTVVKHQITSLEKLVDEGKATQKDQQCLQALRNQLDDLKDAAADFDSTLDDLHDRDEADVHQEALNRLTKFNQRLTQLENVWRQFDSTLEKLDPDQADLKKASSQHSGHIDPSQAKRMRKGNRLKTLGAVLATAVDQKVIALSTGWGFKARRSRRNQERELLKYDTSNQAQVNKTRAYAEILASAAKQGLEFDGMPQYDSIDDYVRHLNQMTAENRNAAFGKVDEKLAAWKKEYKQHAEALGAKWKITKTWVSVKHWFVNSKWRQKGTEVGAFGTEVSLAQGEVREAIAESHAHETEATGHDGAGHDDVSNHDHNLSNDDNVKHGAEHGDAEKPMSTEVFVAKDVLHGMAIVKNADDIRRIQKEINHKKHLKHESHEKLEKYEEDRQKMPDVEKYRSRVAKLYYKKMGHQNIKLDRAEQVVGLTQISRHGTSMSVDVMSKTGMVGHGLKVAGAAGMFGGAGAEFSEGLIGTKKGLKKGYTTYQLNQREKALKEKIKNSKNRQEIKDLKFQLQTVKDLKKQQKVGRNFVSALKGFGMAAGYVMAGLTMLGVTAAGMTVAAPVLLGVFAATAIGLAVYKAAKDSHENWKVDRTEDLILGRGGDVNFLNDLQREANDKKMTIDEVALTRAARGTSVHDKRPTAIRMLHQLKRQTRDARLGDLQAEKLAQIDDKIESKLERLQKTTSREERNTLRTEIETLEKQKSDIETPYRKRMMKSSTAQTLKDAYRMSEDEIFAIVNSPDDDLYDNLGTQLISEYQHRLTE